MRLTELIEPGQQGHSRCQVCQWRCELDVGQLGRCQMRQATPAGIEVLNDGLISAAQFVPIEELRLWHFFPRHLGAGGGWLGLRLPGQSAARFVRRDSYRRGQARAARAPSGPRMSHSSG